VDEETRRSVLSGLGESAIHAFERFYCFTAAESFDLRTLLTAREIAWRSDQDWLEAAYAMARQSLGMLTAIRMEVLVAHLMRTRHRIPRCECRP
jgi:hypothetical protein